MSKTRQPCKRPGQRAERSGHYEVGYGKPPVSTRFKAGQSGNPKGRPRGSKGFNALMRRALSETIPVREDGQLRQMSRREVIIKSLIARALKGDRAIERLLPFMQQLYPDIANKMELRVRLVRPGDKLDEDNGGGSAT
jgi:Family of unknown function (DUF5681)